MAGSAQETQKSEGISTEPYFHLNETAKVEELMRKLNEIQSSLNRAIMHTHMLNVDVVTLFDPVLVDELRHIEEQCESCLTSLTKRETDSIPASSSTTPAMEHD